MKLPLIVFFVILATAIFLKWRQNLLEKEFKEDRDKVERKKEQKKEDDKEKELKPGEIIKISAAGAIFLAILYILVPEFIIKHHKEIIILVVAMIAGSALLGIKQDWEKNSTRKILKTHYIALTIVLVLMVLYKDLEIRKWLESFQPKPTLTRTAKPTWEYTLKAGEKIYTEVFIGQGINLRFQSSSPFYVVAGQINGATKKYLMPNGESFWIGEEPRGPLTLEGIKKTMIYIEKK